MLHIYNKNKIISIYESFKISIHDIIYIHHPITEDIITVIVEKIGKTDVTVSIPESSPYFGQPHFKIKKTSIISIK